MKPSASVSILLTNLHLLDYDYESPKTFPITADIFTSLTNKGKAFEHIIHHLFWTYDPDECDLRLAEVWPVYEPAQSRELRNIVFKWLEDLKANGRLGGVLVRRTTLDDCCGQRYEELLLALSTMILREKIESGAFNNVRDTFAYYQAASIEPSKHHLTILNIAHRHALRCLLDSRQRSKAQWSSFSEILDEKEAEMEVTLKRLAGEEPEELTKPAKRGVEEQLRSKWRNNWLGDPKWLEIILNGDPDSIRDHLLEWPFERALAKHHYFKNGETVPVAPGVASLKELEKKVQIQQRRVEEMRKLRDLAGFSTTRPSPASPGKGETVDRAEKKGLKVEFKSHQKLHLKEMASSSPRKKRRHENEYAGILDSLREELILAGAPQSRGQQPPNTIQYPTFRQDVSMYDEDSEILDRPEPRHEIYHLSINLGDDGDDPVSSAVSDENEAMEDVFTDGTRDFDSETSERSYSPSPSPNPTKISQRLSDFEPDIPTSGSSAVSILAGSATDEDASEIMPTPPTSLAALRPRLTPEFTCESAPTEAKASHQESIVGLGVAFGDDDLLAEQIISTVASASFSPEKASPIKKIHLPPRSRNPGESPSLESRSPTFEISEAFDDTFGESMSLPQSSFDKPTELGLKTSVLEESIITTPKEELLMSDDYTSVFKSRPKIALSPTFTPADGSIQRRPIPNINLSDDDEYLDDDDEHIEYISSPTARKMRHV